MKQFFTILIIVFIGALSTHSQDLPSKTILDEAQLKVFYNITYQRDSTDQNSIRNELMVLLVGEKISKFMSYNNYYRDSLFLSNPTVDPSQTRLHGPNRIRSGQFYTIYKNYPDGQLTTTDRFFMDSFIYHEPMNIFSWDLKQELDTIKGFPVQKATTTFGGRDWAVWFAGNIPVSDGPYKFHGLPGLILKAKDKKGHYRFKVYSITDIKEQREKIIQWDMTYFETTKRNFFKAREQFRNDVMSGIQSSGVPIHESTDFDRIQENMRRRNNPIELIAE